MAAVRAPLSACTNLISAYSPFSSHYDSTRLTSASAEAMSDRESLLRAPETDSTDTIKSPATPAVAPSPIYSVAGTEFADTEEAVTESRGTTPVHVQKDNKTSSDLLGVRVVKTPLDRFRSPSLTLNTTPALAFQADTSIDESEPQSVIHIPSGFGSFPMTRTDDESENESESRNSAATDKPERPDLERSRADSNDSVRSDSTIKIDQQPPSRSHDVPMPPTPLQTTLPMSQDWSSTPRAQTRSDLGALSRPPSSLASILETDDHSDFPTDDPSGPESEVFRRVDAFFHSTEDEIAALRNALSECWTLCNTLASLSYIHRERIFAFSRSSDSSAPSMYHHQQQAWKSCWKLCQNLYDSVSPASQYSTAYLAPSRPTLDLCREFCSCLFDARARDNETADSVLRVSFELNNHLFNTHDRSLPEAFRERTLDFYITLCHRLMKQKARMQEETDSLLRACWSLAEMLFSLRQNAREGRRPDEELLGSAVQACWELCDLFREGWTQIRPERGTPRPAQTTFTQAYQQARRAGFGMELDANGNPVHQTANTTLVGLPETPTTIFEDTGTSNVISPDDPPPQPNILVLGADAPAEMALRSTSSTPAPNVGLPIDSSTPQQQQSSIAQILRNNTSTSSFHGINAVNMAYTPISANPSSTTPHRRFWSSGASSVFSATSASDVVGGGGKGNRTASTITRTTTHNTRTTQPSYNNNNNSNNTTTTNPNTAAVRTHLTPSTATTITATATNKPKPKPPPPHQHPQEDPTLLLLKRLLLTAALRTNRGFDLSSPNPSLSSLQTFVKNLPDTAFGARAWEVGLLESYKSAVAGDAGLSDGRGLRGAMEVWVGKEEEGVVRGAGGGDGGGGGGGGGGKVGEGRLKIETAKAVKGMTAGVYGFGWLRDLYRLVWGKEVEEVLSEGSGRRRGGGGAGGGGGAAGGATQARRDGQSGDVEGREVGLSASTGGASEMASAAEGSREGSRDGSVRRRTD